MKSREEHLIFAKNRAYEFIDDNNFIGALASFQSDMSKHPELCNNIALEMGVKLYLGGMLSTEKAIFEWIKNFN